MSTDTGAVLIKEDKGFITFYKTLDKQENVIRFFDRKSGYYSLHCENAVYVAMLHFKSMKALKYWTETPSTPLKKARTDSSLRSSLTSSSSPPASQENGTDGYAYLTIRDGIEFETVVQKLLNEKLRVEVWTPKANRLNQWECTRHCSPGNMQMFEDILSVKGQSLMVALRVASVRGNRMIGAAFGDATLKTLGVLQFVDNEHLSNLGSFLLQMGVKECLIHIDEKNIDNKKVIDKLQECDIPFINVPNADFNVKNIEQDLTRLLGSVNNVLNELEQEHAMQSLSCLIKHLELLSNDKYFGKFKLETFNLDSYMRMDAATFRGLNIINDKDQSSKSGSIFNLIDQCNTLMGSRKLSQWIKQPLVDSDEIEKRLDFVEIFINAIELRQALRSNDLKKICDLDRLSKRFIGSKATLEDCVNLYDIVQRMPVLISSLQTYDGQCSELISTTFIEPLQSIVTNFSQYLAMVEQSIDLDKANESHEYVIRSSFSEGLNVIQKKKNQNLEKIEQLRLKIADDIDIDEAKLKLHQTDKDGYLLRLSRKDEKLISNTSRYFTHGTQKDGVRFSTSELRKLNEEYNKWSKQYIESQRALVDQVLQVATSFVPLVDELSSLIASLDVFVNLAHVSTVAPTPFVRPKIFPMGTGDTVIIGGRHPCVEVQDGVNFIPNDIELIRDTSSFHVITGPNMGGKSTFIRQVGVIILLAQIGCFVPAEEASVSVVDCILTRIGAGDSQLRGVSTFMAEMLETSYILKTATKHSLIIIDELGRGTSTYDGFGLAWGIAEYICNQIGAFCLFATHFHELTVLEELIPTVNNLHVSANITDNRLTLLYKVEKGSCDQSFGIHVAIMAGFPQEVIDVARSKAAELESFESNSLKKNINQFLEEFKLLDLESSTADKGLGMINNLLLKYSIDVDQ